MTYTTILKEGGYLSGFEVVLSGYYSFNRNIYCTKISAKEQIKKKLLKLWIF